MRNTRLLLGVVVLVVMSIALVYGVSALATYATRVYMEQGGDRMVVDNGGTIEIQNGGTLEIRSGAVVNVNTAATFGGAVSVAGAVEFATATFGSDITDQRGMTVQGTNTSTTVVAKTEDYTLSGAADCFKLFTNGGVTDATTVTYTLDAAAAGVRFAIAGVVEGATVQITAPTGDLVYGLMSEAAKTIQMVGIGYLEGVALDATTYGVTAIEGTWTQID